MRRGRGTKGKRVDLAALRGAFADGRIETAVGVVTKPDGEADHFEIIDGDVLVDVEIMPKGELVLCRLGVTGGGPGFGVWAIPRVGTEVAVLIPNGEVDADAMIVATLASGTPPSELTGPEILVLKEKAVTIRAAGGGDIILRVDSGAHVLADDGSGAVVLPTKADFDGLVSTFNTHTHNYNPGPGAAAPTLVPNSPAGSAAGTQVLKAK